MSDEAEGQPDLHTAWERRRAQRELRDYKPGDGHAMSDNDYQPDLDAKAWQHVRAERPTEWQRMQSQREAERLADTDRASESDRLETLAKLHGALGELERALAEMKALLEHET